MNQQYLVVNQSSVTEVLQRDEAVWTVRRVTKQSLADDGADMPAIVQHNGSNLETDARLSNSVRWPRSGLYSYSPWCCLEQATCHAFWCKGYKACRITTKPRLNTPMFGSGRDIDSRKFMLLCSITSHTSYRAQMNVC